MSNEVVLYRELITDIKESALIRGQDPVRSCELLIECLPKMIKILRGRGVEL